MNSIEGKGSGAEAEPETEKVALPTFSALWETPTVVGAKRMLKLVLSPASKVRGRGGRLWSVKALDPVRKIVLIAAEELPVLVTLKRTKPDSPMREGEN